MSFGPAAVLDPGGARDFAPFAPGRPTVLWPVRADAMTTLQISSRAG